MEFFTKKLSLSSQKYEFGIRGSGIPDLDPPHWFLDADPDTGWKKLDQFLNRDEHSGSATLSAKIHKPFWEAGNKVFSINFVNDHASGSGLPVTTQIQDSQLTQIMHFIPCPDLSKEIIQGEILLLVLNFQGEAWIIMIPIFEAHFLDSTNPPGRRTVNYAAFLWVA